MTTSTTLTSNTPETRNATLTTAEASTARARLHVTDATIGYDKRVISEQLSVSIPDESFTVIVGPNACGKSTLLRGSVAAAETQHR